MHLDLDDDQLELLREILDGAYRDLRYEIADTDNSEYRDRLRLRESRLAELIDMTGGPVEGGG
jgi:hypothetical protein